MSFVAAGAEFRNDNANYDVDFYGDDYDEDDDHDDQLIYMHNSIKNDEKILTSNDKSKLNDDSNGNLSPNKERRVTFYRISPSPSSPSRHSPSPGALIIDDIRRSVESGNLEFLKTHIESEHPIFIDTILKSEWTCLMYASTHGYHHIVHYCLEKGADPNYRTNKASQTPLIVACSSVTCDRDDDLLICVQYLIKFGANVNDCDSFGTSPLICAAKKSRLNIISELLLSNAIINHADNKRWTSLHWASSYGHGNVVVELLNHNADVTLRTFGNETAADIAFKCEHPKIGDVLKRLQNESVNNRKLSIEDVESLQFKSDSNIKSIVPTHNFSNRLNENNHLEILLNGLGLSELLPKFKENAIEFKDLLILTDDDLLKMGINEVGYRKRILNSIGSTHKQKWENESLPNLRDASYISCPDSVFMMVNINTHLTYIERTIMYLRHKIKKEPKILEYNKDTADVTKLYAETIQSLSNTRRLFDELKYFRNDLNDIKDNVELGNADLIKDDTDILHDNVKRQSAYDYLLSLGIVTLTAGVFVVLKYRSTVSSFIAN